MSLYRATLLRWVDGDTFDARVWIRRPPVDLRQVRVRITGVAAPETKGPQRPLGLVTHVWIMGLIPVGSPLALEDYGAPDDEAKDDTFGRWLCRVAAWPVHPDRPLDLGAELLRRGYAVPYEDRKTFDWQGALSRPWPMEDPRP